MLVQQALPDDKKQFGGLVYLPMAFLPLLVVWLIHRQQSAGNPYRGLVWGATSWYWLLYFGLLVCGALVAGLLVLTGGATFDPQMTGYIERTMEMMKAQGNPLPPSAAGQLSIGGWVTAVGVPLFGPWFGTLGACAGTFPLLGWLARRLLVRGRQYAFVVLLLLSVATGAAAGMLENQQLGEAGLPLRVGMMAMAGLSNLPLMLWLFYRTRSAVLPALAVQSYACGFAALTPFLSDTPMWLSAPGFGLACSGGALLLGVALWVWQDPGGMDLAVAAVANDGTPLTPEMYAAAQAYSRPPENATG
jgi:hypothetical protein